MREIRWAVLGTGVIANEMAAALEKNGKKLYAVGNRTYEKAVKFGEKYGIEKVYTDYNEIIYVFLTIFLYLLKCPQSLILSALRAFCFCGKPHISRSIFLYFRYQAWLKSW